MTNSKPGTSAAPLIALVEAAGGPTALGATNDTPSARAYYRARKTGRITLDAADQLAHDLFGKHPCEIWDDWFGAGA